MWAVVTIDIGAEYISGVNLFITFDDARRYAKKSVGEYVDFCSDEYEFNVKDNGMNMSISFLDNNIEWSIVKADYEIEDVCD